MDKKVGIISLQLLWVMDGQKSEIGTIGMARSCDQTERCVLDAQTQNGDEPVGEYSFSGQSCLSSANSC